jgi:AcrR family transcriptional regulator
MKKPPLTKAVFAAAALRCFERYGPQRTSMIDIAEEAGASRQSIYRFFPDRSELIQYILDERITAVALSLKSKFEKFETLEEVLVEGSMLSLRTAAEDRLLQAIMTHAADHDVEQFMLRGTTAINNAMDFVWSPALDKARAEGLISSDLSNQYILEWLRHVHSAVRLRDDLQESQRRQMLQDFLVPSIMRTGAASQRPESDKARYPRPVELSPQKRTRRRAEA